MKHRIKKYKINGAGNLVGDKNGELCIYTDLIDIQDELIKVREVLSLIANNRSKNAEAKVLEFLATQALKGERG